MKHLTNILLVVALICYAFLPFYDLSLQGSMTGFEFTAAKITHANGFGDVLFGLIPFLTCFAAIAFNCLRSKYWVLAAIVCIAVCLNFYVGAGSLHPIALTHAPEVASEAGEGFRITGMAIGYKLGFGLTIASLVLEVISILPFKFNQAVDRSIEQQKQHVRDEFARHHKDS